MKTATVEFLSNLAIVKLDKQMITASSDDYISVTLNHVLVPTATFKCVFRLVE